MPLQCFNGICKKVESGRFFYCLLTYFLYFFLIDGISHIVFQITIMANLAAYFSNTTAHESYFSFSYFTHFDGKIRRWSILNKKKILRTSLASSPLLPFPTSFFSFFKKGIWQWPCIAFFQNLADVSSDSC
jgi:hypothetical protein